MCGCHIHGNKELLLLMVHFLKTGELFITCRRLEAQQPSFLTWVFGILFRQETSKSDNNKLDGKSVFIYLLEEGL